MPPIPPTFDPALPATNSQIVSQELRDQFNSLNDKIDLQAQQIADLQATAVTQAGQIVTLTNMFADYARIDNSSAFTNGVDTDNDTLNDPPTFDDVDNLRNKLNELINGLRR